MAIAKHRQKTFIDPIVQGNLLKRVVLHWLCFIGTSMAAITLLQIVLGNPEKTILEHLKAAASQYALFFIVMFTLLPAFILDTIRLSHRFAGPIYRMRQTFKSVANGEPFRPIRFREKDFWKDIADDFNLMMDRLGVADQSVVSSVEKDEPRVAEDSTAEQEALV